MDTPLTSSPKGTGSGIFRDEIHYRLEGPFDAPAVVFTHGVGMDHCTFKEQLEALKKEYRVLVWDLPGHGASPVSPYTGRYTAMAADRLNDLMSELGIAEAVHVGQSMGSLIVQHFLRRYPEKVIATVHVPGIEMTRQFGSGIRMLIPLYIRMLRRMPEDKFCTAFGTDRAERPEVQRYLIRTMRRTGKALAIRITRDMIDDLNERHPDPQQRPMLIVFGNKDQSFIQARSRKWHSRSPDSQLVEIPGANHIVNQDQPELFNKTLQEFLKEVLVVS
jgi:3-oxoadipate enol-lactonase